MNAARKIPRIAFRKQVYYGEKGEIYLSCSGEFALRLSRAFGPDAQELRRMLAQLRARWSWSQAALGAVLGVPKHTIRRWEDGTRNPCGAATKLIWLMHQTFVKEEPLVNMFELVSWGNGTKEVLVFED